MIAQKKLAAHVLLIGGIAKRKQSWARRVRTVAYSYLVKMSLNYNNVDKFNRYT